MRRTPLTFTLKALALFLCSTYAFADVTVNTDLHGIEGQPKENVQARLQEVLQGLPKPLAEKDVSDFFDYSGHTVKEGLAPFAYFSPRTKKSLQTAPDQWTMTYYIHPGKQSLIEVIQLQLIGEGATETKLQNLLHQAPFQKGHPFLSEPYEQFKNAWINSANALGYIKANYTVHKIIVDRHKHQAAIYLTLDTGPRYYFGAVHFNPNPLRDSFLQRYVNFSTGQTYSTDKIEQLQTDLINSGYFNSVAVNANTDTTNESHTVPIDAHVKTKPRQQYILGGGYGTDTGPRATLGSNWRYVNSYGHRFNTMLRLSEVQNTASLKYVIPGKHPLSDEYNINSSLQTNTINQGSSQLEQLGAGYTLTRGQWQRNFSLSYQIERFHFFSNPTQISRLLLPGISLQNIASDNALFPTEAHRISISVVGAKQGVLADTNLLQAKLSTKWIHTFAEKNMIVVRNEIGYTMIHNINLLPLSLNFFAGGAQSVRGYAYNDLGPGRYLFTASAEYRYEVIPKWYATTFFDLGNAFNNFPTAPHSGFKSNLGAFYNLLQRGAGFGVVWNSPVGAMELTVAQAITRPGRNNRVQFNMGTDF